MQKAINHTMNFFIDGERPKQGLDEVDKLLIRKRELLRKCGEGRDQLLTPLGITLIFGGVKKDSHIERLLIGRRGHVRSQAACLVCNVRAR